MTFQADFNTKQPIQCNWLCYSFSKKSHNSRLNFIMKQNWISGIFLYSLVKKLKLLEVWKGVMVKWHQTFVDQASLTGCSASLLACLVTVSRINIGIMTTPTCSVASACAVSGSDTRRLRAGAECCWWAAVTGLVSWARGCGHTSAPPASSFQQDTSTTFIHACTMWTCRQSCDPGDIVTRTIIITIIQS